MTDKTRLNKPNGELKSLGGRKDLQWKQHCANLKKECRAYIKAQYPDSASPMKEHPKLAVKFYESKGYKAPYWVLNEAGVVTRYAA